MVAVITASISSSETPGWPILNSLTPFRNRYSTGKRSAPIVGTPVIFSGFVSMGNATLASTLLPPCEYIPAYAGGTTGPTMRSAVGAVYPRLRGGGISPIVNISCLRGLSRRRGETPLID